MSERLPRLPGTPPLASEPPPPEHPPGPPPARRDRLFPRPSSGSWGVGLAIGGFLAGSVAAVLLSLVAASALGVASSTQVPAVLIADLVGLWIGLAGSAVLASRLWGTGNVVRDLGLRLRPWPDLPLGVAIGLAAQFVLVPVMTLAFQPFVPNLSRTLSNQPGRPQLLHAHGAGLVFLALCIAVGSPVVEELFFRGLVLRSLDRWLSALRWGLGPLAAVVLSSAFFGWAHGEGFVLGVILGLFGVALALLAKGFDRLGPGIVAHATFNSATVVALALVATH